MNIYDSKLKKYLDKRFPNGFCYYNALYTILHPWKIYEYVSEKIIFAWQRVFRGWDDSVIWSIDQYLSEKVPEWIRELKNSEGGIPMIMFEKEDYEENGYDISNEISEKRYKEYLKILDKIINGFESYAKIHKNFYGYKSKEYEQLERDFNEGFDLFRKYFSTLNN